MANAPNFQCSTGKAPWTNRQAAVIFSQMETKGHPVQLQTALGDMTALFEGENLVFLDFNNTPDMALRIESPAAVPPPGPGITAAAQRLQDELGAYLDGSATSFSIKCVPRGTPFQRRVWTVLQTIPYGETWTYTELALALGSPRLTRAAAAACGSNPCLILIPCHRVVGSRGSLTGYRGGLDRKRGLLDRENRDNFTLRG